MNIKNRMALMNFLKYFLTSFFATAAYKAETCRHFEREEEEY